MDRLRRVRKYIPYSVGALLALLSLLIVSLSVSILSLYLLEWTGVYTRSEIAGSGYATELFARLFLLTPILLLYGPLLLSRRARSRFVTERWIRIALTLFAVGTLAALGDPLHMIRHEGNWIRYFTAGVLTAAGLSAVVISLRSGYRPFERILGGLFGLLLILAASDELLQFHERAGHALRQVLPSSSPVSPADMVTLAVALIGVVVLVLMDLVWHFTPRSRSLGKEPRYRRTFAFFSLAVVTFSTAMVLDSYDWYLERVADGIQAAISGSPGPPGAQSWTIGGFITQSANSLEEILEYMAAIFLLMMIGCFFSIGTLGFGADSSIRPGGFAARWPAGEQE